MLTNHYPQVNFVIATSRVNYIGGPNPGRRIESASVAGQNHGYSKSPTPANHLATIPFASQALATTPTGVSYIQYVQQQLSFIEFKSDDVRRLESFINRVSSSYPYDNYQVLYGKLMNDNDFTSWLTNCKAKKTELEASKRLKEREEKVERREAELERREAELEALKRLKERKEEVERLEETQFNKKKQDKKNVHWENSMSSMSDPSTPNRRTSVHSTNAPMKKKATRPIFSGEPHTVFRLPTEESEDNYMEENLFSMSSPSAPNHRTSVHSTNAPMKKKATADEAWFEGLMKEKEAIQDHLKLNRGKLNPKEVEAHIHVLKEITDMLSSIPGPSTPNTKTSVPSTNAPMKKKATADEAWFEGLMKEKEAIQDHLKLNRGKLNPKEVEAHIHVLKEITDMLSSIPGPSTPNTKTSVPSTNAPMMTDNSILLEDLTRGISELNNSMDIVEDSNLLSSLTFQEESIQGFVCIQKISHMGLKNEIFLAVDGDGDNDVTNVFLSDEEIDTDLEEYEDKKVIFTTFPNHEGNKEFMIELETMYDGIFECARENSIRSVCICIPNTDEEEIWKANITQALNCVASTEVGRVFIRVWPEQIDFFKEIVLLLQSRTRL